MFHGLPQNNCNWKLGKLKPNMRIIYTPLDIMEKWLRSPVHTAIGIIKSIHPPIYRVCVSGHPGSLSLLSLQMPSVPLAAWNKGISNFSHYPVKCGKRLAGVRSQTILMQSSPHRLTSRERVEGDEQGKMERVRTLKRLHGGDWARAGGEMVKWRERGGKAGGIKMATIGEDGCDETEAEGGWGVSLLQQIVLTLIHH